MQTMKAGEDASYDLDLRTLARGSQDRALLAQALGTACV